MARGTHEVAVLAACSLAVLAGLFFVLQDRVTELTVNGVGTIKAATEQAVADAEAVARLKDRVENQSATVDLVAKQAAMAKETSEQAIEQNKRAEQKLQTLDNAIREANSDLNAFKSVNEFAMIVVAAQNDDRKAFDKLQQLAEDKNSAFTTLAQQAWTEIFEAHSAPFYSSGFKVPWNDGIDPSKFSLSDLAQQYNLAQGQLKPALLEYIWSRNDITKIDRLDFLIKVMRSDSSLRAVEYAGRYFTQGTGQDIKPLVVAYLSQWWGEHRQEYKGQ